MTFSPIYSGLAIYYPGIYLEGLRKTTKVLRIARVSTEIRTKYLPSISPERCRHSYGFCVRREAVIRTVVTLYGCESGLSH
jgi:hypothetical protein